MRLLAAQPAGGERSLPRALASCVCATARTLSGSLPASRPLSPEEAQHLLATTASWQLLPEDVLLIIVDCFHDKAGAAVMRRVCTAWRDAFNAGVRRISIMRALLPGKPSAFPSLQHLLVQAVNGAAVNAAVKALALPAAANLTVLEIAHTSALPSLPPGIEQLSALRTVAVTHARLKSLGRGLHLLPHLQHLDLSTNMLSELPACIGSLGTLRKLDVSDNTLSYLPEGIGGLTGLHTLRARQNTLLELPDSLVELVHLTALDLSLNRLKTLPARLTELTGLRQLGLFAAFSHSLRNEGASTVRVLAQLSLAAPQVRLHAEEVVLTLVKLRVKQLQGGGEADEPRPA